MCNRVSPTSCSNPTLLLILSIILVLHSVILGAPACFVERCNGRYRSWFAARHPRWRLKEDHLCWTTHRIKQEDAQLLLRIIEDLLNGLYDRASVFCPTFQLSESEDEEPRD